VDDEYDTVRRLLRMDWQQRMTMAIEYLERNLYGEADLEAAAAEANCSSFHFHRMFEVITGVGPGEYLRRRRLSEAAMALSTGGVDKVIDLALRFGYESPDSFSRAFRREFGCLPSDARKGGVKLHSYPPLSFSVVLKGDKAMEYRIEVAPAMALAGISIHIHTKDESNWTDIPAFWDAVMKDGRWKALFAKADFKRMGVCGVCRNFDMAAGEFIYSIAIDEPASMELMPAGSERFEVPASTWGKFTSRGPLRPNYKDTINRIFAEWMPASDWEHAGSAEIEYYPESGGSPDAPDYWCEYWVPLRKGKS
jgi:AraC family transcriptional regulator